MQSFRTQLQKKNYANICRIERDGISAIKFKAARPLFLSDVSVTAPSSLLKLPCVRITTAGILDFSSEKF